MDTRDNKNNKSNLGTSFHMLTRRDFLRLASTGAVVIAGQSFLSACQEATSVVTNTPTTQALGERVPTIVTTFVNQSEWIEFWTAEVSHFHSLGLELKLEPCEFNTCIEVMYDSKNYGDIMSINWSGREERIDPSFFLTEMFHSSKIEGGGLNAEKYINKDYDVLVEQQAEESDQKKRQELVWECQKIIERDTPIYVLVFQDIIHAYNSKNWKGVVPRTGAGIAGTSSVWTYINIEPLSAQKELRVGWLSEPVTLNPVAHKDTVEHIAMLRFIYDTYVKLNADLEVVPWAAESWNWVDDKTLDIVLRENMKFHDGIPVTVEDVKFTFDYIKKWQFGVWTQVTDHIDNVEIVGDNKIRFYLPNPYPPFIQNVLTYAVILPKHIWEKVPEGVNIDIPDNWEPMEQSIGSGFYKFGYWNRGQEVYLAANKEHWSAPKVDGVHFVTVPSLEGLLGKLETQELDMVFAQITPTDGERLEKLGYITAVKTPNHGFFESNADLSKKPFSDLQFRLAIDHILDRDMILNDVFGGAGTLPRGGSPITPANKYWHNPNLSAVEFNIDTAKQILREAGYGWDTEGNLHYPKV